MKKMFSNYQKVNHEKVHLTLQFTVHLTTQVGYTIKEYSKKKKGVRSNKLDAMFDCFLRSVYLAGKPQVEGK